MPARHFNEGTLIALLTQALREIDDPAGAVAAFGGPDNFYQTLAGIARIETKNGPMIGHNGVNTDDLFLAAGDSPVASASRFEHLALKWEKFRPALPAAAYGWLHRFGLTTPQDPEQQKLNRAVLLAAARAEMVQGKPAFDNAMHPDEPAYHSRLHFLHVLQGICHLIEVNESLPDKNAMKLDDRDKTLLILAALIHDLDHPGGGNRKDPETGEFIPYQIEKMSFDLANDLFIACGLSCDDRMTIWALLRATDPNGPSALMKKAMKLHERGGSWRDLAAEYKDSPFNSLLMRLLADRKLCYMCAVLVDADLNPSGGSGPVLNTLMSKKFTEEKCAAGEPCDLTTLEARLYFLENFIGEDGFASAAGRAAFNTPFKKMLQETRDQIAAKKAQSVAPAPKTA